MHYDGALTSSSWTAHPFDSSLERRAAACGRDSPGRPESQTENSKSKRSAYAPIQWRGGRRQRPHSTEVIPCKSVLIYPNLLTNRGCGLRASTDISDRDPRYRLQSTDTVEIHYRYTPEFDQTITVQPDGFATLQIVGDIKLQANTRRAHTAIVEKARQRLRDPEITLLLRILKALFVVAGEVANPGRFEMRGTITAVQAIAMAGGFRSGSAKHSQVILFRRVGSDLAKTQILDLKAAMSPSATEPLADLHPGDMLVVPQNSISKIERFVKWGNIGLFMNPMSK